jgi:hypothetical protein
MFVDLSQEPDGIRFNPPKYINDLFSMLKEFKQGIIKDPTERFCRNFYGRYSQKEKKNDYNRQ